MVALTAPVDWRAEFVALAPYIHTAGGVVKVRHAGDDAAPSAFVQALSAAFETPVDGRLRTSLRLDRRVYSTRYLADVRAEFLRKLAVPSQGIAPPGSTLSLITNNDVGRDLNAEVSVTLHGTELHSSEDRTGWVRQVRVKVQEYLRSGNRIMVIIMDGTAEDQDEIWRYLWKEGIADLVGEGLVLVYLIDDRRDERERSSEAPAADLELVLPAALDLARQAHAREDVAAILRNALPGMPASSVKASAQTLVHSSKHSVRDLHDNLAGLVPALMQDWGD